MKFPKTPEYIYYKRTNLHEQREYFESVYRSLPSHKKLVFDYMLNRERRQKHRLHMVAPSPWPIYSASSAFLFVMGMILWMHYYTIIPLLCGFLSIISSFIYWFRDIIREGVYMGYHTEIVQSCLRLGFVLFLVSEVMFFFGFFWALFHFTLTPSIFVGGVWPPQGIVLHVLAEDVNDQLHRKGIVFKAHIPTLRNENQFRHSALVYDRFDFEHLAKHFDYWVIKPTGRKPKINSMSVSVEFYAKLFRLTWNMPKELYCASTPVRIHLYHPGVLTNPYRIPLLNTALLLTSGFMLTVSHSYLRVELFLAAFRTLLITIMYGLLFIYLQGYEYFWSCFAINDGVYGSIFYMLTGFHGFHVIIGTVFLIVCACRLKASHFTSNNHFAFEAAAWYWHFVDVVWILLYLLLYLWPNAKFFSINSTIVMNPFSDGISIELTMKYFWRYCNQQRGMHFYAGTNFEYHYPLKIKIVKYILDHFEKDIIAYEKKHRIMLSDVYKVRFNNLRKYTHW